MEKESRLDITEIHQNTDNINCSSDNQKSPNCDNKEPYPLDLFYERLERFARRIREQEESYRHEKYLRRGVNPNTTVTPRYEIPLLGANDD